MSFDGEWEKAKMSEQEYRKAFASADDELLIGRVEPRAGDGLGRFAWRIARALGAAG